TAAWDRMPPVFVTRPAAIVKTGTQDGFDDGQTMMSPARLRPKSDGLRAILAGPRTMPGEAPVPRSRLASPETRGVPSKRSGVLALGGAPRLMGGLSASWAACSARR